MRTIRFLVAQEFEESVKETTDCFAILVMACEVTNAVDTFLFGSVDDAKSYCAHVWKIDPDAWEGYLVSPDPESSLKLNGEGVRYVGWKVRLDDVRTMFIHAHEVRAGEIKSSG